MGTPLAVVAAAAAEAGANQVVGGYIDAFVGVEAGAEWGYGEEFGIGAVGVPLAVSAGSWPISQLLLPPDS